MLEELVQTYSGVQSFTRDSLSDLLTLLGTNTATTIVTPSGGTDMSERAPMLDSDSEEIVADVDVAQPAGNIAVGLHVEGHYANSVISSLRRVLSF